MVGSATAGAGSPTTIEQHTPNFTNMCMATRLSLLCSAGEFYSLILAADMGVSFYARENTRAGGSPLRRRQLERRGGSRTYPDAAAACGRTDHFPSPNDVRSSKY